jgi:hypothetical protein
MPMVGPGDGPAGPPVLPLPMEPTPGGAGVEGEPLTSPAVSEPPDEGAGAGFVAQLLPPPDAPGDCPVVPAGQSGVEELADDDPELPAPDDCEPPGSTGLPVPSVRELAPGVDEDCAEAMPAAVMSARTSAEVILFMPAPRCDGDRSGLHGRNPLAGITPKSMRQTGAAIVPA